MAEKGRRLPILPLKDQRLVVFPGLPCVIDVGRPISINAISAAKAANSTIVVAMQKDEKVDEPVASDFYGVCTEAEIKSIVPLDDEGIKKRVFVIGVNRARLRTVGKVSKGDLSYLNGEILPYEETPIEIDSAIEAYVSGIFEVIDRNFPSIVVKNKTLPKTSKDLSVLIDSIVGQIELDGKTKLSFLGESDVKKRLESLVFILGELVKRTKDGDGSATSFGGGSNDEDEGEIVRLQKLVNESGMPEDTLKIVSQELRRLKNMNPAMSEYSVTANYIEAVATLPWNKKSDDRLDIEEARKSLDGDHYGLEKPKERILEYLAVRKLAPNRKGAILCFVGPPGVGKTSLGRSIAKAMGREFVRLSLGGVHDEAEIRGHRKTYVGAMTGKIIQYLKKTGVSNPLYMLDEIDKLSKDFRGDPASALLEVLDPEQNCAFVDNYLNVPFDLSNVFFITTANDIGPIPPALQDRMEIIEIPGYSPHDKLKIAQNHLIPKQKEANGLKDYDISITAPAITKIIEEYTGEAGVRTLERECGTVLRKIAVSVASGKEAPSVVRADSITRFLGPPKVFAEKAADKPEIGLSTGLAWSQHGGSLLFVEASLYPGKGDIKLTGNLGKVLQESASAALTWIKANAERFGIPQEVFSQKDIHIHFPAGATPKDGPSAGIAISVAMVSLFTSKPIRNDMAMTGEITLRGRVLPIGGLVEKVLAAHRGGIKEVLYPVQNLHSIDEIPQDVRNEIKLTPVSNLGEAIDKLLLDVIVEENNSGLGVNKNNDKLINMGK